MKSQAARKLAISFGIGIGGGAALGVVDLLGWLEVDAGAAIVSGLLLTVVTELALIMLAQERADRERHDLLERAEVLPRLREAQRVTERATLGIANLAKTLPGGGRFASFMAQNIIESLHKETRRVLENGIEVEAQEVPLFWTTCLLNVDADVKVAAYINPAFWWHKPYGRANVAVQKDKVDEGIQITRIFILETEEELDAILETAEDQHRGGLSVRYIHKAEIDEDPLLNGHREKAGSYDVALIGNEWAVLHYLRLDPGTERYRDTDKLVLTKDSERRDAVRNYLSLLEESAHAFELGDG